MSISLFFRWSIGLNFEIAKSDFVFVRLLTLEFASNVTIFSSNVTNYFDHIPIVIRKDLAKEDRMKVDLMKVDQMNIGQM